MGNQQNKRQQTALATAVLAYAEHIENPAVIQRTVEKGGWTGGRLLWSNKK